MIDGDDLTDVLDHFETGTYEVKRTGAPTYAQGRAVAGATTTLQVPMMEQPATGRDLQRLPEAFREREARVLYSKTQLLVGDRVTLGGEVFEVGNVQKWDQLVGFWRAVASLIETA